MGKGGKSAEGRVLSAEIEESGQVKARQWAVGSGQGGIECCWHWGVSLH